MFKATKFLEMINSGFPTNIVKNKFTSELSDEKYKEHILAIKRASIKADSYDDGGVRSINFIPNDIGPFKLDKGVNHVIDSDLYNHLLNKSFIETKGAIIIRRDDAEYNPLFKQLVVCCLPYSEKLNKVLMLKSKETGNYELVQGHVTANEELFHLPLLNLLKLNMVRELKEEVAIDEVDSTMNPFELNDILFHSSYLSYTIKMMDDIYTYSHIGFLFLLDLDNLFPFLEDNSRIGSGEPDKHEVVMVDLESVLVTNDNNFIERCDSWSYEVLNEFFYGE